MLWILVLIYFPWDELILLSVCKGRAFLDSVGPGFRKIFNLIPLSSVIYCANQQNFAFSTFIYILLVIYFLPVQNVLQFHFQVLLF